MFYNENTEDTKTLIKIAAKKVFLKKGFAGTRLKEITDEAGIGRTALHYYFSSKENIFAEVLQDFFSEVARRTPQIKDENITAKELMKIFIDDYIDTAIQSPEIDLFMLNECNENPEIFKKIRMANPDDLPALFIKSITNDVNQGKLIGDPKQILLTFMSICMFPFAGMTMIKSFLAITDSDYINLLKERKVYLHSLIDQLFKS